MAAFSTTLSKYCMLIWFSPHSHSLKDVQAALSLRGWMQDMKHVNEIIIEKSSMLYNVKNIQDIFVHQQVTAIPL